MTKKQIEKLQDDIWELYSNSFHRPDMDTEDFNAILVKYGNDLDSETIFTGVPVENLPKIKQEFEAIWSYRNDPDPEDIVFTIELNAWEAEVIKDGLLNFNHFDRDDAEIANRIIRRLEDGKDAAMRE